MSKVKAETEAPAQEVQVQEPANEAQETSQPQWLDELLNRGTVTITANSVDELAEMVNAIPAEVRYGAGAVGKNPETGIFALRLDLVK